VSAIGAVGSDNPGSEKPIPAVLKYAEWVDRRPKLAALVLVLASMPALYLSVIFFANVRAGLTELLPPDAPSAKALAVLHDKLGGFSHMVVVAESDNADANRRFIVELGDRLEKRHVPEIRVLQKDTKVETEWGRNRALLLMPQAKFDEAIGKAEEAIAKAKRKANPMLVDLEDDEEEGQKDDPKASFEGFRDKLKDEIAKADQFPNGLYETRDGHIVLLMAMLEGSETELEPSTNMDKAVKEEVAAIRSKYPAEMKVGYQGEVPNLVEEHDAILADLSLSSAIVFLLVGGVIFLYFRSMRGLIAMLFAVTPGLLFTFAIGKLTSGHLNSNTAFLGSIIGGNGINYPLMFLAFYRARHASEPRPFAVAMAARQAFFGTLGAALAASAAYGALAVSTFRGFSQFGWIGGVGMITTWLFTFIAMPIAISLFNPPRVTTTSSVQKWLLKFFSGAVAPRALAAFVVVLALTGAAVGVRNALLGGMYEMKLSAMRNRSSITHGAASWDSRVCKVFGIWLNPVGGLVDDPNDREKFAAAVRETMVEGPDHLGERVQTISTVVPPLEQQQARIERLKKIAKAMKAVKPEQIPEDAKPYLDRWLKPENLTPITLEELPLPIRKSFSEVDGRTDRIVLLFPSLKIDYDDARNVVKFDHKLAEVPRPPGAVIGGGFLFMAEIIDLVQQEAPRIVGVVAVLVALVLLPLLRKKPARILVVVVTVGAVAVLAQACMLAVGVRINMLSFGAVPITIGVGADYVVNLLGAMDALKLDARRACARMGGAIFLCSATTIIGYASLVVAQSGALRTFGWAAVLGEIMAVTTVLLVLPVAMAPATEAAAEAPAEAKPAGS
jgi:predicted RND superfamily exporter protein